VSWQATHTFRTAALSKIAGWWWLVEVPAVPRPWVQVGSDGGIFPPAMSKWHRRVHSGLVADTSWHAAQGTPWTGMPSFFADPWKAAREAMAAVQSSQEAGWKAGPPAWQDTPSKEAT
jgi:hypothetical protein